MKRRPLQSALMRSTDGGSDQFDPTPMLDRRRVIGCALPYTFSQQQYVAEIEERHRLWGQPVTLSLPDLRSAQGSVASFACSVQLSCGRLQL